MKPPLRITGLLAASLLVASACSGGDDVAPTTTEAAATEATTTTAAPATTTTSTSTTTTFAATTTTAASNAVGDMTETHEAIVELLETLSQVAFLPDDAEPYLPDLSNPDPIVALEEAWKFENWMISVYPSESFLPFYAAEGSEYANRTARTLNIWETAAWRVEDFSDTYYFEDPHIVDLGSAEIPDDIRSAITPGAAAIVYTEGAGERTLVDQKSGDLQDTFPAYGPRVALAVLVRTVAGWRVFYTDTSYAD